MPQSKKRQSKSTESKQNKQPPTDSDLQRISKDITALRTALNMQVTLLSDIEQTLHLSAETTINPKR